MRNITKLALGGLLALATTTAFAQSTSPGGQQMPPASTMPGMAGQTSPGAQAPAEGSTQQQGGMMGGMMQGGCPMMQRSAQMASNMEQMQKQMAEMTATMKQMQEQMKTR
jgi:hypothetical protein